MDEQDIDKLRHSHSPLAIQARLLEGPKPSYLRDFVYGGIDGTVTTFAVVSGVVGAGLSHKTILILGVANLIADGFSMAASNFLGTRTEHEEKARVEAFERVQIQTQPEGEREEVRQILKAKGLRGETLENATNELTKDPERWVEFMLAEEYGLSAKLRDPVPAAMATFASFVLFGLVPLLPFLFGMPDDFFWSSLFTAFAFFGIGSLKSRWTLESWLKSGLSTLAIGVVAALLAYGAGAWLSELTL